MVKILHLTLHKKAFDVMVTGEKKTEYRHQSKWITSRLIDKNGIPKIYDFVRFTNGYGSDKPYFVAEFRTATRSTTDSVLTYSNGLRVNVYPGNILIHIGKITEKGNLQ